MSMSSKRSKGLFSGSRREALKYFIPLGLAFVLLLILNIAWGQNWIDSDMSAEMVFSDLLGDTGHFIASPDWYYSTEFRIAYTQLLFVPLLKVLDSWAAARIITNIVFYIVLVLSYFYMMLGYEKKHIAMTSAVLLLPISETIAQHMQLGNTYMPHMILMFLTIGLVRRLDADVYDGKPNPVRLVLLAALSIICGASGVRYFLIIFAPLLIAGIWRPFKMFGIAEGALKKWRSNLKLFYIAMGASFFALIGYFYNTVYIRSMYIFTTYESVSFVPINNGIWYERIASVFGCLLEIFGYIPGGSVLSLRGVVTVCAFVMIFLMFYMVRRTSREVNRCSGILGGEDIYTKEALSDLFFVHFFVAGFAVMAFFLAFTDTTLTPRYFSSCIYMALPILTNWLSSENDGAIRKVYMAALVFCLSLATLKISYSLYTNDKNEARREVAQYLVGRGLTHGYSLYDDSNVLVELSDGVLSVGAYTKELDRYFLWSTPKRFYEGETGVGDFLVFPSGTDVSSIPGAVFEEQIAGYDIYICR